MTRSTVTGRAVDRAHGQVLTDDVWIQMPDGCRLFAIVRRPNAADPVPAVLTATPYGAKTGGGVSEHRMLTYLAARGYATVQVDLRGSADSEGVPQPEYSAQEQDDLIDVLAWMAAQDWCTGRLGMRGISWSGFNTLQVAARHPPKLQAIMSACSTDDRYADGEHFMGGCLLASDHPWWGTEYLRVQAHPPSPEVHGARWVEIWRERLERIADPVTTWLDHQRRDEFWQHGSVREDYSAIRVPVLMCAGLHDGYRRAAFRVLEAVERSWAIVGPWGHLYPYEGEPGPSISAEFEIRWWERWLRDVDNGVEEEPRLRVFIHDPRPVRPAPRVEPGRWVGIHEWPAGEPLALELDRSGLSVPAPGETLFFSTPLATGADAPPWCPDEPLQYDHPTDQRAEDGRSLCYTTPPLERVLDIVGMPALTLTLSADRPVAKLAVRLCDVMPDGSSRLLAVGALNLTHRHGHVRPEPVPPGEPMRVKVQLRPVGHRVPAGHRLRVALSPNYWPWLWPAPEPVTLALHLDEPTILELPLVPAGARQLTFEPGEDLFARTDGREVLEGRRTTATDLGTGETVVRSAENHCEYSIVEGDPLSARVRVAIGVPRPDRVFALVGSSTTTADASSFFHEARLVAYHGAEVIADRTFTSRHTRDFQ